MQFTERYEITTTDSTLGTSEVEPLPEGTTEAEALATWERRSKMMDRGTSNKLHRVMRLELATSARAGKSRAAKAQEAEEQRRADGYRMGVYYARDFESERDGGPVLVRKYPQSESQMYLTIGAVVCLGREVRKYRIRGRNGERLQIVVQMNLAGDAGQWFEMNDHELSSNNSNVIGYEEWVK
jgi:hypothetical protein